MFNIYVPFLNAGVQDYFHGKDTLPVTVVVGNTVSKGGSNKSKDINDKILKSYGTIEFLDSDDTSQLAENMRQKNQYPESLMRLCPIEDQTQFHTQQIKTFV